MHACLMVVYLTFTPLIDDERFNLFLINKRKISLRIKIRGESPKEGKSSPIYKGSR